MEKLTSMNEKLFLTLSSFKKYLWMTHSVPGTTLDVGEYHDKEINTPKSSQNFQGCREAVKLRMINLMIGGVEF